jgi:5-methyltetrahydropteroyltriglutamate--homocysteine methyltransferase
MVLRTKLRLSTFYVDQSYITSVQREAVIAGTDCGLGGRVHPQLAWAKLQSLAQGAELATKQLWR